MPCDDSKHCTILTMYSWGSAINGELGLGGLEDAQVNIPSRVPFNSSARLAIITTLEYISEVFKKF